MGISEEKKIYIFALLVGCNVCGRNHTTESCSFLRELKPVSIKSLKVDLM